MTDILCHWLNEELKLSKKIDQSSFAREFSNGYYAGEVLHKYQLQDDFDQFSQNKTSDSKLNNFTRIEPILLLLGIPFDTNVARDIMTEKHGVATRLMYQLYIALTNKKKANLTGVAMETMKPAAPAKLNAIESGIYRERLKHMTPRQTDLNLDTLISTFHEKQVKMEHTAFKERFLEEERRRQWQQTQREERLEKSRQARARQSELVAKIQAATVHIPKPPSDKTAKGIQHKRDMARKREAEYTKENISTFEDRMKLVHTKTDDEAGDGIDIEYILKRDEPAPISETVDYIRPTENSEYIGKIRKRLNEDASAREEREKRRRKVLVDQMKAHDAQEEARREEMLVNRLMRQSQQERRIAVQLLQTRHEKEIIRNNRIMREKQYEERRLKDFDDALNRESEMARLAKLEYAEQTLKDQELHNQIVAERAETKYRKRYDMCMDIINQVVDFTCKVGEYRELTNNLLPSKLMREWKDLFVAGMPLYEVISEVEVETTQDMLLEEERQRLLDEGDFLEYKNMTGEWQPPEGCDISIPPRDNPIVGHVVQRLFNMVHPPSPPPPPPVFPPFPIRACVLGKVFSGKTTCVQRLATEHRLEVLSVDELVNDAIEAYKANENMEQDTSDEARMSSKEPSETDLVKKEATDQPSGFNVKAPTGDDLLKSHTESELQGSEIEKPSPSDLSIADSSTRLPGKDGAKPQLSPRAKLGSKAMRLLKKGKPVDDQIIIDVFVEAIRRIPEGTGWVLDGFPTNYSQAKMLEKALSGYDASAKETKEPVVKDKKGKKSVLAPDPRPPPPAPEPSSGIDVVILFDLEDELSLRRAAGRSYALQSNEQYQQEFKPPPEGSATGIGKQERVLPVDDTAHDQEQIQHRITGFMDNWAKMEKWFSRFGTLKKVDAALDQQAVYFEVEKCLEDTIKKLQGVGEDSGTPPEQTDTVEKTEDKPEEQPAPVETISPEAPADPPRESTSREGSRKGSRTGSARKSASRTHSKESPSSGKSPKGKKGDKSASPKRSLSPKKSDSPKKGSRGSSPKSPKRGKSGKKVKTPEPEPEPEPEEPTGPPPPQPGSEEWEFIDKPLEKDLAEVLARHWEAIEAAYIYNSKEVFHNAREERESIYRYFYKIRKDYLEYLRRPDHKQEFVEQWQKEYNLVADDMRDDEETKSELHQRVDDLRERLWSICDERKEQAENERSTIMNDGWMDDHLGLLSNHYITLMQAEVDRYQDTVRLLKDYYRGMDGHIPDELNASYARIPLIELPVERPDSPDKSSISDAPLTTPVPAEETSPSAKSDRTKSPKDGRTKSPKDGHRSKSPKDRAKSPRDRSKSRTPSAKRREKSKEKEKEKPVETAAPTEDSPRKKIPLVPRRPVSPDPDAKTGAAPNKDKKDKKGMKKGDDGSGAESPIPPVDADEKLVFDAFHNGLTALISILSSELATREAEEEAEKQKEVEKKLEREKAMAAQSQKKGGKKGKSRSPSPKKGGRKEAEPKPAPSPGAAEEESEEDKLAKSLRDHMRQEYYFAIQEEEVAARARLDLIKFYSYLILQDLKGKADECYKDQNDWLGARFLKEMESIDHLSEIVRHTIEGKDKITNELVLQQQDFLLNEELKVLRIPSPVPEVRPAEYPMSDQFTVAQLQALYEQFATTAPTGVMSSKAFIELFETMVAATLGTEQLPDMWTVITSSQIQDIANSLASDTEYVDWRRLLVALAHSIPYPTQSQLLDSLQHFQEMDQKSTGYVTREQYDRTNIWFKTNHVSSSASHGFDRLTSLKAAFFDILADHDQMPARLDYASLLMYFSIAGNPVEGFLRALSVAISEHVPRIPRAFYNKASVDGGRTPENPEDEPAMESIPDDIPDSAMQATVPLDALYQVLHHGESSHGDSHRFSMTADPEDATSKERLTDVYRELGSEQGEPVLFRVLVEHPLIQDIVIASNIFKALDLKTLLSSPSPDLDTHSMKTMD